eukprot:TRINITY_DN29458_c0_g2_i1.p1 TRINITY_DN29458_c0_g2~~TRINITY_DN29458_c0_g2_i1.p1  ORF type:complete len:103 (+),score=11.27 TRINITY_DN29458_c0_g2_i1:76-384(+)
MQASRSHTMVWGIADLFVALCHHLHERGASACSRMVLGNECQLQHLLESFTLRHRRSLCIHGCFYTHHQLQFRSQAREGKPTGQRYTGSEQALDRCYGVAHR